MSKKENSLVAMRIIAPLTGQAVALEQVPDPVFSQKIIGDGVAVIPEDGKIVSPVDGEVDVYKRQGYSRRRPYALYR